MLEEREARKSKSVRPNHEPDTEPVAPPHLLRVNAPDALESEAPHMVPASPVMFGGWPNIIGLFNATNGRATTGDAYFSCEGAFSRAGKSTQVGNADGGGEGGRLELKASRESVLISVGGSV